MLCACVSYRAQTGELFDYIVEKGRLMEDEARHFFQQIISGAVRRHKHRCAERACPPFRGALDCAALLR